MTVRWFWLYSDGKTVKEISWDEWSKIVQKDWNSHGPTRLLCRVHGNDIHIRKGSKYVYVKKAQLLSVLGQGDE